MKKCLILISFIIGVFIFVNLVSGFGYDTEEKEITQTIVNIYTGQNGTYNATYDKWAYNMTIAVDSNFDYNIQISQLHFLSS